MNNALFFMNSPGPEGLFSLCKRSSEDSPDTRTYSVTGGVGISSHFIEKIASSLEKEGLVSQRFLNFYGEDGLDGVCFPEIDVYIFDGNISSFPMTMPDCRQYTVDLGVAAARKELFLNKALIEEGKREEEKYFSKAVKFLSTAVSVKNDIRQLTGDAVNTDKVERFVSRFVKREFGTTSSFSGREYFRMLTSVTPEGIMFPEETLASMCPKLYCIDDKTGTVSTLLVSLIRESALLCGFDVISLLSPFEKNKSPEHVIVPELGLGVITSNESHPYKGNAFKRVSSSRFFDSEKMKKHRARIRFNLNAEKELLNQASFLLGEGRKCRGEYFEIYSRSYDREKIKSLADEVTREILSFISCT